MKNIKHPAIWKDGMLHIYCDIEQEHLYRPTLFGVGKRGRWNDIKEKLSYLGFNVRKGELLVPCQVYYLDSYHAYWFDSCGVDKEICEFLQIPYKGRRKSFSKLIPYYVITKAIDNNKRTAIVEKGERKIKFSFRIFGENVKTTKASTIRSYLEKYLDTIKPFDYWG